MFIKACAAVCAISTLVTASISVIWYFQSVAASRALDAYALKHFPETGATSPAEMVRQEAEITRQLEERSKKK